MSMPMKRRTRRRSADIKVAIVTGVEGFTGGSIARALGRDGATIVANYARAPAAAQEVALDVRRPADERWPCKRHLRIALLFAS